jgi:hypothetical protein
LNASAACCGYIFGSSTMEACLLSGSPPPGQGGPFGSAAYLAACARHDGGTPATVQLGGVSVPVVVEHGGGLHTPYGYPQPYGDCRPETAREFASAAVRCARRWRCALSPVGFGAELAEALGAQMRPSGSRPIAIHDLDDDEPTSRFSSSARGMVRRAMKLDVETACGPPTPEFSELYRANMDSLDARAEYYFDDDYMVAMRQAGTVQVSASDGDGLAAAALFLIAAPEASYHLSARRLDPAPPPGATNLIIAEGLRQCRDAGAKLCYLGGGRATDVDDPLLKFKAAMSTRIVDRPVFEHAPS